MCVTIFLKITLFIFSSFGIKLSQCIRSRMYLVITLVNVSLNWRFRWYIFFLSERLFPKVESLSFTSFFEGFFLSYFFIDLPGRFRSQLSFRYYTLIQKAMILDDSNMEIEHGSEPIEKSLSKYRNAVLSG